MKAKLLTILAVLIFLAAKSQTIIPKLGITLNNLSASDDIIAPDENQKMTLGVTLGASVEYSLSDRISIQPELLFTQKGPKITFDFEDQFESIKSSTAFTLNYLEVPILVKVKFGGFYVNLGPSIGLGIGGKYKYQEDYVDKQDPSFNESFNESGKVKFGEEPDNYSGDDAYFDNRMNIGMQFGAGYKIADKILIELRYGLGMSNLFDKPAGVDMDPKSKTNSLQFTIGYPISIGL